MVEQGGGTVEQSWWNTVVEKWNSHAGLVWWNSRTVMIEQCGGTVEHRWRNSVINSGTVLVEQCGGTVEQ